MTYRVQPEEHPFETLKIWESKLQNDFKHTPATPAERLQLLLEHSKDCEVVVYGSLKDLLFDLYEAQQWGFASATTVAEERRALLALAERQLGHVKQAMLPGLAQEAGCLDEYLRLVRRKENHTVDDYERLAELDWATVVWHQNLQRDLAHAAQGERHGIVAAAWDEARRLVQRCVATTRDFWATQLQRCPVEVADLEDEPSRATALDPDAPLGSRSAHEVESAALDCMWQRLQAAKQYNVQDAAVAALQVEE